MRAAASSDCARARNWQSQRVTRRSLALRPAPWLGTVFQPVPSQRGHTSAGALITWDPSQLDSIFLFRLCTRRCVSRKAERLAACVHPVKEPRGLWRALENLARQAKNRLGRPISGQVIAKQASGAD